MALQLAYFIVAGVLATGLGLIWVLQSLYDRRLPFVPMILLGAGGFCLFIAWGMQPTALTPQGVIEAVIAVWVSIIR